MTGEFVVFPLDGNALTGNPGITAASVIPRAIAARPSQHFIAGTDPFAFGRFRRDACPFRNIAGPASPRRVRTEGTAETLRLVPAGPELVRALVSRFRMLVMLKLTGHE